VHSGYLSPFCGERRQCDVGGHIFQPNQPWACRSTWRHLSEAIASSVLQIAVQALVPANHSLHTTSIPKTSSSSNEASTWQHYHITNLNLSNPFKMSFFLKAQPILRQAAVVRPAPRLFSTAFVYQKSPTDSVKDGLKAVDRTVSDTVVAGIDKGGEWTISYEYTRSGKLTHR